MVPLLVAEHVSFSWKKEKPVLCDLSFQVQEGEFISIVGENGAGKTTLVRLLLGLIQPNMGSLTWSKTVKMGYVPQFSRLDEFFPVTAYEVVLMGQTGLWGYPYMCAKSASLGKKALQQVGLWSLKHEPFSKLSGGQKQRILIARALCASPDVLFLDEPTASLDEESTRTIYGILDEFSQAGNTIFTISHDLNFVSSMTDRVFCLQKPFSVYSSLHYVESLHPSCMNLKGQRALICHEKKDASL